MKAELKRSLLDWLEQREDFGPLGWRPAGVDRAWLASASALAKRLAATGAVPAQRPTTESARRERPAPPREPAPVANEHHAARTAEPAPASGTTKAPPAARREQAVSKPPPVSATPPAAPAFVAPADWAGLRQAVVACERCALAGRRTRTVFGVGSESADLLIVGEAPGEREDQLGEPFVGPAGELLDTMLHSIGFAREDVYIANILKCRPPGNRDPKADEAACCRPYLDAQIALLQPKLILAMGRVAGTALQGIEATLGSMRGVVGELAGRPLRVTYHPAALLRNDHWKRPAWEDLKSARRHYDELGGRPGSLEAERKDR